MPKRVVWFGAIIVVSLLVAVFFLRGRRNAPEVTPRAIGDFDAESVVLQSPELDLALLSVRGTDHADYTDWAFVFECREPRGCRAELQLEVDFVSGGENRRLGIKGVVDADRGETMRIARIQRPAVAIASIEKVTIAVEASHSAPTVLPTPMQ